MKILVTGSNGMLGSALIDRLRTRCDVCGAGDQENQHADLRYIQLDITDAESVRECVNSLKPQVIIHTAAYTDVDGCELDSQRAFHINAEGTKHLACAAKSVSAFFILISSDYVFSGKKASPYVETDPPDPVSVYGKSKWKAEQYVRECLPENSYLIVRTSWLYGPGRKNFVEKILKLAKTEKELRIAADSEGSPTYTIDMADAIGQIISHPMFLTNRINGFLNITNSGHTSWFGFAKEIL